jgi:hypothetical protein
MKIIVKLFISNLYIIIIVSYASKTLRLCRNSIKVLGKPYKWEENPNLSVFQTVVDRIL